MRRMNNAGAGQSNSTMNGFMNRCSGLLITVFLLQVAATRPLWAQATNATATAAVPKIQFAQPQHDFGRIAGGLVVKHEYVFTNTGTASLTVSHVQAACGCTALGTWSREVAPGATGTIPIQFNSGSFMGAVSKTVTVTCNDPAQPTVYLQLNANIWKPVEIQPMFAVINVSADANGPVSSTVRIAVNQEEPLGVYAPESNLKHFTAELVTNTPGREYNLIIKTVPPMPPGNTQGQITFKTTSTNTPTMSLSALAIVQPAVVISPAQITLPAQPSAQPQSYVIAIRNNSTAPFTVSNPTSSVGTVAVALKEVEAGRQYNVELTIPAGYDLPAGQPIEITANSTHPAYPLIKVPVNQLPKPSPPAGP